MKQLKELIGYIGAILMLAIWIVTILLYGKKIDANTETNKSVEQELKNLYELNVNQSNWNTKVGTIIEIQTGIQVNP